MTRYTRPAPVPVWSSGPANDNHPSPTTPLRLPEAVAYAFPHGGMTVSGLRREAARGRLAIERIAGKDFTTLAAIEEMRKLCRVSVEVPTSTSSRSAARQTARSRSGPAGSSETDGKSTAQAAFLEIVRAQKGR